MLHITELIVGFNHARRYTARKVFMQNISKTITLTFFYFISLRPPFSFFFKNCHFFTTLNLTVWNECDGADYFGWDTVTKGNGAHVQHGRALFILARHGSSMFGEDLFPVQQDTPSSKLQGLYSKNMLFQIIPTTTSRKLNFLFF